jgi:DNA-binding CsgD family transcriptional regulator/pimeloyl-ACP methyl ester carboxylesterase
LGNLLPQWRVRWLREVYERLAASTTLVLYDGRGMGASGRRIDTTDLGVDAHLRDLEAVVEAAGVDPVALLGQYHAVPTALAYAAAHPERVSRLVLFGGSARLRDVMNPVQTQALLSLVEQDWDLFADAAAQAWLGWDPGSSGRELAEVFRSATSPALARDWFAAAADVDVTHLVPRVRAPALVLHRQGERQMPLEPSQRLADALPNGSLLPLPGALPTLFVEDAARDLHVITQFLDSGRVAAPATAQRRHTLTRREEEVLALIAAGGSNADVARALGISVHTVERHASALYRKIAARGRADATAYALRRSTSRGE